MLLHNTGYQNQPYVTYMDQSYYPYHPVNPAEEFYYGMVRTQSMTSIPANYQTGVYQSFEAPPSPPVYGCPCPSTPPQQSFLHQILTGKGYRNSAVGGSCKSAPQAPVDNTYSSYPSSCCFGNSVRPSGYSSIQQNR